MARYDDLNTSMIAYATFVSSITLLVIILLVRALCYSWVEGEDQRKLANAHYVSADQEIGEQKARISGYEKATIEVAPPAGEEDAEPRMEERIHIPVEQAKTILLREMASKKEEPSA